MDLSSNTEKESRSWSPEPDFGKDVGMYWIGPYGVLVSEDIFHVIAPDNNIISKDRGRTLGLGISLDKQTYMYYRAEYRDGKYYYVGSSRKNIERDETVEVKPDKKESCTIL